MKLKKSKYGDGYFFVSKTGKAANTFLGEEICKLEHYLPM
jgi:hypothetical protein